MESGKARRRHAWIVSGIVATAVVVGGGAPAPGQVPDPVGPEVTYVDAYGPGVFGYEDCDGTVYTEDETTGWVYVELEDEVDADVAVGLSFSGDLADDLVDPPTEVVVAEGDAWGEVEIALDELETGELTVTVEPGLGYVADLDDTYTLEVTDEVEVIGSCDEDISWLIVEGRDRQTIDVGDEPEPFGFFEDFIVVPDGEPATTSTVAPSTTVITTTTEGSVDQAQVRAAARAVPEGVDTPVDGTLPPGLTYADDTWAGAATTAGTYDFDVRVCFDRDVLFGVATSGRAVRRPAPRAFPAVMCLGTLAAQVVVEAAAVTPPPPAGPAQPVRTTARFAG